MEDQHQHATCLHGTYCLLWTDDTFARSPLCTHRDLIVMEPFMSYQIVEQERYLGWKFTVYLRRPELSPSPHPSRCQPSKWISGSQQSNQKISGLRSSILWYIDCVTWLSCYKRCLFTNGDGLTASASALFLLVAKPCFLVQPSLELRFFSYSNSSIIEPKLANICRTSVTQTWRLLPARRTLLLRST